MLNVLDMNFYHIRGVMLYLSNDLIDVSLHTRSCFPLGLYLCFKLIILRVKLGLYSISLLSSPSLYIVGFWNQATLSFRKRNTPYFEHPLNVC